MKNLTITVDEDVARWAKVFAARHDTSVSKIVGELLREKMRQEEGYRSAMERYLSRPPTALKASGRYPKREELYARPRREEA
jgi:plasmid stability protein